MNMRCPQTKKLLDRKFKLIQERIDFLLKKLTDPHLEYLEFELDHFSSDTCLFLDMIIHSTSGTMYTESIAKNIRSAINEIKLPKDFEFMKKEHKDGIGEQIKNNLLIVKALLPIHADEIQKLCDLELQGEKQLEQDKIKEQVQQNSSPTFFSGCAIS